MLMSRSTRLLYRQHGFPIFQNRTYSTVAEASSCSRGDIELVEDEVSGLIYNASFEPDRIVYDSEYHNEQGLSGVFQRHLECVADLVSEQLGKDRIVEIGCGKGTFLRLLASRGIDVTGFDPAYEGDNPRIAARLFRPEERMFAKGIVLRHVLEHIHDPFKFLYQLREANGGCGLLYIEVPCLEWILSHNAWFDIFYEHVNYFRLSDFGRMFGRVIHASRLFGGQYLGVVVDLASLRSPQIDPSDRVEFRSEFGPAPMVAGHRESVVVWGAASKGVIFALLQRRDGKSIDFVVDINPAKQGRYLPVTGLRVYSPAEALRLLPEGAMIYVMNSMYLEEIKELSENRFRYVRIEYD
jgi:hypothetical protein